MTKADFPTAAAAADAASDSMQVQVSRVLRASRERVFDAWTKPEQWRQWMGPAGMSVPELEADIRPGGKFRIVFRGTPPPTEQDKNPQERTGTSWGTFVDVVPHELIRYKWNADWVPGEESLVTVRLSDVEGGTLVEVTHEKFTSEEVVTGYTNGWNGALGKLATFLEG